MNTLQLQQLVALHPQLHALDPQLVLCPQLHVFHRQLAVLSPQLELNRQRLANRKTEHL
jgi:hypothetical protein